MIDIIVISLQHKLRRVYKYMQLRSWKGYKHFYTIKIYMVNFRQFLFYYVFIQDSNMST